jgi:heme oxygenase
MLGADSTDLPDADADLLLNTSWWDIADAFDFKEKEGTRTWNTVIGTLTYATAADENGIQQISIEDPDSKAHALLKPMTLLTYESGFVDRIDQRATPEYYIRRDEQILLYPTPDKVYEITEYYWKTLADIAGGGLLIPQAWHEIITYGAAFRGFAELGDFNRSNAARKMQVDLMQTKETITTREKVDRPYAQVQMLRPRYP